MTLVESRSERLSKVWATKSSKPPQVPEALDKAYSVHPDLIMMDLRLPVMNGDEATVRLKRNLSTRNILVVISTAWTTACNIGDRVDRALAAGAEEILYKPFHLPMLRDVLRTYLLA